MATKTITVKLDCENGRKNLMADVKTLTKWDEFTKGSTQKSLMLSAALEHFIAEYSAGNVKIVVEL